MSSHEIIDAEIRNQIALRRYIAGRSSKMLALFEKYDAKLAKLLRLHLRKTLSSNNRAHKTLLKEVKALREELLEQAAQQIKQSQDELAPAEYKKDWALLALHLGLQEEDNPTQATTTDANKIPFSVGAASAATLAQWLKDLLVADFKRIRDALSQGLVNQDSPDDIVERVIGKKRDRYRTGVVARTRHNIQALVTTALAHLSQVIREHLWRLTPKVTGMIWISVLDGKTTLICIGRDNKVVMFGSNPLPVGAVPLLPPGARPPAHGHCRSLMAPLIGTVLPDRRTFEDFLRVQSAEIQDDILGKRKAQLYRQGKVPIDGFVSVLGVEYTIKQLESARA